MNYSSCSDVSVKLVLFETLTEILLVESFVKVLTGG